MTFRKGGAELLLRTRSILLLFKHIPMHVYPLISEKFE